MTSDQEKVVFRSEVPMRGLGAVGAALGFVGVALGAFGAHGLSEILEESGRTAVWKTAAHYNLIHAVMVVLSAMLGSRLAGVLFSLGIGVFSGSLYLLCVLGISWLGAITPIGGVLLLGGWGVLIFRFLRR